MNDWAADSVPLTARGFLLVLVVCLHVAGAAALLRLSEPPRYSEESTILQVRWIEMPPPAPVLLPPLLVEPRPVRVPEPPPRVPAPKPVPAPIPAPVPAPASITVDIPPVAPVESFVLEDSSPRTDAVTMATTTEGSEDYVEPDFNVSHFSNPKPEYPFQSRRLREQGLVKLRVHVTVEGHAGEVTLHTSSGHERLDKAAVEAVKRWQFRPAQRAGMPVAGWVIVPVRFELQ
ncbi:MAG: energy transducer TonB [Burkholderiales bacterium]|jgi:protein TonB|nr:energy transducer TonB [Burkholderiales bacterium]